MKNLVAAVSVAILCSHASACPLSKSLADRYGITFSGFATPAAAAPDTAHGGTYVRVVLPDVAYVADGFRHTAVMDTSTKKVWILRTGGFAGVYEWYGPVDAVDASLDNCMLEPTAAPSARAPQPAARS
ncbi:hypothetical protein HAV22_12480 [Massilia sp. TW-1]|uniref:Lipoprotein n=1 Tax=Telluria antibiotica TaxID=2717319 RepID=A0ABX0PBT5_9BURK|nr:hypothetical protein [Telluria antibiotica]NIA54450.1 hypothetical protein [Telluria antibiotica]